MLIAHGANAESSVIPEFPDTGYPMPPPSRAIAHELASWAPDEVHEQEV